MINQAKFQAFTLAEVLITIAIIGIVAAMTLPSVIANYKKKEIPIRLKKFSSTMQNAFNMAKLEHGPVESWKFPEHQMDFDEVNEFAHTYLYPYITGIKDCTSKEGICQKMSQNMYTATSYTIPVHIFADGGCFLFVTGGANENSANIHFTYDYNCLGKPNEPDKDIFTFYLHYSGDTMSFRSGNFPSYNASGLLKKRSELMNLCKNHTQTHNSGICSYLIEFDVWEIKDDYSYKL